MAFLGSFFGKASRATCGISSIGINNSVGRLVNPNAVDSSRSSSLFTLYVVLIFLGKAFQCGRQRSAWSIKRDFVYTDDADDIIDEILSRFDKLYIFISFAK